MESLFTDEEVTVDRNKEFSSKFQSPEEGRSVQWAKLRKYVKKDKDTILNNVNNRNMNLQKDILNR